MKGLILASWRDCVFHDVFCLERDVSEGGRVVTKDGLGGAAQLCEDSGLLEPRCGKTTLQLLKGEVGRGWAMRALFLVADGKQMSPTL